MYVIDAISDWAGKIFSFLAIAMMFIIAYEVLARYAFNAPTIWANEAVTYLCGIYAVMGGAYTLRLGGHVNVDVLYAGLSLRMRAVLDLATFPFFLAYFGILLWLGIDLFWDSLKTMENSGTAWSPPIYPLKIMIPLAAFFILLQGSAKFIRNIKIALIREGTE
jgi:TRAP-type mannitol/chloroaromatic compound transport system permease small subunit